MGFPEDYGEFFISPEQANPVGPVEHLLNASSSGHAAQHKENNSVNGC